MKLPLIFHFTGTYMSTLPGMRVEWGLEQSSGQALPWGGGGGQCVSLSSSTKQLCEGESRKSRLLWAQFICVT